MPKGFYINTAAPLKALLDYGNVGFTRQGFEIVANNSHANEPDEIVGVIFSDQAGGLEFAKWFNKLDVAQDDTRDFRLCRICNKTMDFCELQRRWICSNCEAFSQDDAQPAPHVYKPGDRVVALETCPYALAGELGTVMTNRSLTGEAWYHVQWEPEDAAVYLAARHFKPDIAPAPHVYKPGDLVVALGTCEHADAGTFGVIHWESISFPGYYVYWDSDDFASYAAASDIAPVPEEADDDAS